MPVLNGYATETELNRRLGKNYSSGDGYILLQDTINAASRMIDHYTSSFFYTKTLTAEKVDMYADSENGLYLSPLGRFIYSYAPIISITQIDENGTTLTEDEDFFIYKADSKIIRSGCWTSEHKGVEVTGTIGYTSAPNDIKQACLSMAEAFTGLSIRAYVSDDGQQTDIIMRSVPGWVWDRLDMYKNYRVL